MSKLVPVKFYKLLAVLKQFCITIIDGKGSHKILKYKNKTCSIPCNKGIKSEITRPYIKRIWKEFDLPSESEP